MAKQPTITDLNTLADVISPINDNFDNIQSSFDNTLSRDGSTPNQMEADIDLNSNDLLNVGDVNADNVIVDGVDLTTKVAEAATSATDAANSASEAATSETNAAASALAASQYDPTTRYADVADFLASTTTYTDDTHASVSEGGFVFKAVSSGGDVTNAGGQEFTLETVSGFANRDAASATAIASLHDDVVVPMNGLNYITDSAATGTSSATNDLSVDGLKPFGQAQVGHYGGDLKAAIEAGNTTVVIVEDVTVSEKITAPADLRLISAFAKATVTATASLDGPLLTADSGKLTLFDIVFDGDGFEFANSTNETGMVSARGGYHGKGTTFQNIAGTQDSKAYALELNIGKNNSSEGCTYTNITSVTNSGGTAGFCGGVFISNDRTGADVLEVATHTFDHDTFEDIYTKKNSSDVLFPDSDGVRTYVFSGAADNTAALLQTSLMVRDCKFRNVLKGAVKAQSVRSFVLNCSNLVDDLKDQGQTEVEVGFRAAVGHEAVMHNNTVVGNIKTAYSVGTDHSTVSSCIADLTHTDGSFCIAGNDMTDVTIIRDALMFRGDVVAYCNSGLMDVDGIKITDDFGSNGGTPTILKGQRGSITARNIEAETTNSIKLYTPRNSTTLIDRLTIKNVYARHPTDTLIGFSTATGEVTDFEWENVNWEGAGSGVILSFFNHTTQRGFGNTIVDTGSSSSRLYDVYSLDLVKFISQGESIKTGSTSRTDLDVYIRALGTDCDAIIDNMTLEDTRGSTFKRLADFYATRKVQLTNSQFRDDATASGSRQRVVDIGGTVGNICEANTFDCSDADVVLLGGSDFQISRNNSGTFNTTDNAPRRGAGASLQSSGDFTY